MRKDNVIDLSNPASSFKDCITEILRDRARKLLEQALEVEIESYIDRFRRLRPKAGKRRVVRNGYHAERTVLTGIVLMNIPSLFDFALRFFPGT